MGLLLAALLFTPSLARADAGFAASLHGIRLHALERKAAELLPAGESSRLTEWLGWYGAMHARPALSTQDLAARLREKLAGGRHRALVLGESHGVQAEQSAARVFIDAAIASVPVGIFLHEKNIWDDAAFLTSRGIPVDEYANQFRPREDLERAARAARKKLLISYTGCAHSTVLTKDYSLWTLEGYRTWGYKPGQTDMLTIEEVLKEDGRRPLYVPMMMEQWVWATIQRLFLKRLLEKNPTLESLEASLLDVRRAWSAQIEALPEITQPIAFYAQPGRDDFWLGVTPSSRRPAALLAVSKALALPQARAWAGHARLKLAEALWSRQADENGAVAERYEVVLHKTTGETFRRSFDQSEL